MTNLHLADGRTLEYLVTGPADGTPLVLHHGTPSAAIFHEPAVEIATRHGLRTVIYNRPGYAGSSPQPGRTVAAAAADVAAVLDDLGADRFLTLGWSGGGPHALACAALLPDRCLAAATVAGVAPYDAEGVDWLDGMAEENHEEFKLAAAGAQQLTDFLEPQAVGLAEVEGELIGVAMGGLVSEVDRAALTDEFADYLAATLRSAVSSGIAGWRDDDLAFMTDWGFDLGGIKTPISVWQGSEDRMVPFAHGQWLASRLVGAAVHLEPGEGHLTMMVDVFGDIVAELAAHVV